MESVNITPPSLSTSGGIKRTLNRMKQPRIDDSNSPVGLIKRKRGRPKRANSKTGSDNPEGCGTGTGDTGNRDLSDKPSVTKQDAKPPYVPELDQWKGQTVVYHVKTEDGKSSLTEKEPSQKFGNHQNRLKGVGATRGRKLGRKACKNTSFATKSSLAVSREASASQGKANKSAGVTRGNGVRRIRLKRPKKPGETGGVNKHTSKPRRMAIDEVVSMLESSITRPVVLPTARVRPVLRVTPMQNSVSSTASAVAPGTGQRASGADVVAPRGNRESPSPGLPVWGTTHTVSVLPGSEDSTALKALTRPEKRAEKPIIPGSMVTMSSECFQDILAEKAASGETGSTIIIIKSHPSDSGDTNPAQQETATTQQKDTNLVDVAPAPSSLATDRPATPSQKASLSDIMQPETCLSAKEDRVSLGQEPVTHSCFPVAFSEENNPFVISKQSSQEADKHNQDCDLDFNNRPNSFPGNVVCSNAPSAQSSPDISSAESVPAPVVGESTVDPLQSQDVTKPSGALEEAATNNVIVPPVHRHRKPGPKCSKKCSPQTDQQQARIDSGSPLSCEMVAPLKLRMVRPGPLCSKRHRRLSEHASLLVDQSSNDASKTVMSSVIPTALGESPEEGNLSDTSPDSLTDPADLTTGDNECEVPSDLPYTAPPIDPEMMDRLKTTWVFQHKTNGLFTYFRGRKRPPMELVSEWYKNCYEPYVLVARLSGASQAAKISPQMEQELEEIRMRRVMRKFAEVKVEVKAPSLFRSPAQLEDFSELKSKVIPLPVGFKIHGRRRSSLKSEPGFPVLSPAKDKELQGLNMIEDDNKMTLLEKESEEIREVGEKKEKIEEVEEKTEVEQETVVEDTRKAMVRKGRRPKRRKRAKGPVARRQSKRNKPKIGDDAKSTCVNDIKQEPEDEVTVEGISGLNDQDDNTLQTPLKSESYKTDVGDEAGGEGTGLHFKAGVEQDLFEDNNYEEYDANTVDSPAASEISISLDDLLPPSPPEPIHSKNIRTKTAEGNIFEKMQQELSNSVLLTDEASSSENPESDTQDGSTEDLKDPALSDGAPGDSSHGTPECMDQNDCNEDNEDYDDSLEDIACRTPSYVQTKLPNALTAESKTAIQTHGEADASETTPHCDSPETETIKSFERNEKENDVMNKDKEEVGSLEPAITPATTSGQQTDSELDLGLCADTDPDLLVCRKMLGLMVSAVEFDINRTGSNTGFVTELESVPVRSPDNSPNKSDLSHTDSHQRDIENDQRTDTPKRRGLIGQYDQRCDSKGLNLSENLVPTKENSPSLEEDRYDGTAKPNPSHEGNSGMVICQKRKARPKRIKKKLPIVQESLNKTTSDHLSNDVKYGLEKTPPTRLLTDEQDMGDDQTIPTDAPIRKRGGPRKKRKRLNRPRWCVKRKPKQNTGSEESPENKRRKVDNECTENAAQYASLGTDLPVISALDKEAVVQEVKEDKNKDDESFRRSRKAPKRLIASCYYELPEWPHYDPEAFLEPLPSGTNDPAADMNEADYIGDTHDISQSLLDEHDSILTKMTLQLKTEFDAQKLGENITTMPSAASPVIQQLLQERKDSQVVHPLIKEAHLSEYHNEGKNSESQANQANSPRLPHGEPVPTVTEDISSVEAAKKAVDQKVASLLPLTSQNTYQNNELPPTPSTSGSLSSLNDYFTPPGNPSDAVVLRDGHPGTELAPDMTGQPEKLEATPKSAEVSLPLIPKKGSSSKTRERDVGKLSLSSASGLMQRIQAEYKKHSTKLDTLLKLGKSGTHEKAGVGRQAMTLMRRMKQINEYLRQKLNEHRRETNDALGHEKEKQSTPHDTSKESKPTPTTEIVEQHKTNIVSTKSVGDKVKQVLREKVKASSNRKNLQTSLTSKGYIVRDTGCPFVPVAPHPVSSIVSRSSPLMSSSSHAKDQHQLPDASPPAAHSRNSTLQVILDKPPPAHSKPVNYCMYTQMKCSSQLPAIEEPKTLPVPQVAKNTTPSPGETTPPEKREAGPQAVVGPEAGTGTSTGGEKLKRPQSKSSCTVRELLEASRATRPMLQPAIITQTSTPQPISAQPAAISGQLPPVMPGQHGTLTYPFQTTGQQSSGRSFHMGMLSPGVPNVSASQGTGFPHLNDYSKAMAYRQLQEHTSSVLSLLKDNSSAPRNLPYAASRLDKQPIAKPAISEPKPPKKKRRRVRDMVTGMVPTAPKLPSTGVTQVVSDQGQVQVVPSVVCNHCGGLARFVCSGCKAVAYCSQNCQAESWREHHKQCR